MIANRFNPLGDKRRLTAKYYIQDGLIAMWDGIENVGYGKHDANATKWIDLIGTNHLDCGKGVSFSDNACVFTGQGSAKGRRITQGNWQGVTIDMAYSRGGTSEFSCGCYGTLYGDLANFGIRDDKNAIYTRFTSMGVSVDGYPSLVSISSDGTNMFVAVDGTTRATRANSKIFFKPNTTSEMPFCVAEWQYNYSLFKGNAYCVRIYNRALTDAEVAHNYATDKARFGL